MKQSKLSTALLCALAFGVGSAFCCAQENADNPTTYDPNATASSLGLEPFNLDFFPIFPWDHLENWGDKYQPMEDGIRTMAECDCTMSAFVADDRGVELAKKNGLRCIYEMRMETFDDRNLSEEEIQAKLDAIDKHVKERVESTKDDPAVIGYYLRDEPGAYLFRSLATAVAAVKKYAPGKLAYVNLYPGYASTIGADVDSQLGTYSFREYLERYVQEVKPQLLSYDNYMVEYSEDMRDLARASVYFSDLFEVRRVALKYEIPFWFIGSSLCIMGESSPPTAERYAYQAYTALAAGAEGLTWFLYYPLGWKESPIDENGDKTLSWLYMRDVNTQVEAIGTYLKDFRSTEMGLTPLYTKEEAPDLQQFPDVPKNVLKNLSYKFSGNAKEYESEPQILVGEFAQKDGDKIAALAVNINVGTSERIFFEKPEGYSTLKVVSPVDGKESVVKDEDLANGFWIIPGHGKLFVFEK